MKIACAVNARGNRTKRKITRASGKRKKHETQTYSRNNEEKQK